MTDLAKINYSNRDYSSIKTALLQKIPLITDKWTDWNESDVGMAILESFVGISDMLNFYVDTLANENFLPTARSRYSVQNLCNLIDYHLLPKQGASATATITLAQAYAFDVTIPQGFRIATSDNTNKIYYASTSAVVIPSGEITANIQLGEGERHNSTFISDGSANQSYSINTAIQLPPGQNTYVVVYVNGVLWSEEKSSLFGTTTSYLITLDNNDNATISFGDGTNGHIPASGTSIQLIYWSGNGVEGRIGTDVLTDIQDTITVGTTTIEMTSTNDLASSGGYNRESIEHAKYWAPKMLKTLDRLVSLEDYDTYVNQYSKAGYGAVSLAKSYWKSSDLYACEMDLYVLSKDISGNYVVCSPALIEQLQADLELRRCWSQQINILDGILYPVLFDLDIKINSNYNTSSVITQVTSAINTHIINLSFGSTLYLAKITDLAMSIDGVENVVINTPLADVTVDTKTVITVEDIVVTSI